MSAKRARRRAAKSGGSPATPRPGAGLAPDAGLVRVALTFFAVFAVLQLVLWALVYGGYFDPVQRWTAGIAGACAAATGVPAVVMGNDIALPSRILRVDADCTGVTLVMIYTALVLAYPLSWRNKVRGLLIGVAGILSINLIRLVAVARISGPLDDRSFLFVHDYLFKIVMMAVVIAAWALYLSNARRHASEA